MAGKLNYICWFDTTCKLPPAQKKKTVKSEGRMIENRNGSG